VEAAAAPGARRRASAGARMEAAAACCCCAGGAPRGAHFVARVTSQLPRPCEATAAGPIQGVGAASRQAGGGARAPAAQAACLLAPHGGCWAPCRALGVCRIAWLQPSSAAASGGGCSWLPLACSALCRVGSYSARAPGCLPGAWAALLCPRGAAAAAGARGRLRAPLPPAAGPPNISFPNPRLRPPHRGRAGSPAMACPGRAKMRNRRDAGDSEHNTAGWKPNGFHGA
jgi:hypothetical protein